MCFKKIFRCNDPVQIAGNKVALLFGINDYMGSENDLSGCLNDINDVAKKLKNEFPEFQIYKFKDSEVTTQRFMSEIENAMNKIVLPGLLYIHYSGHGCQIPNIMESNAYDEALYLYNGPFVDDNIWNLQQKTPEGLMVVAKFDSCFSGDIGRNVNPVKKRFYPLSGIRIMKKAVRKFNKSASDKWIIFSGCGEEQTSSDAYINEHYNGAFTWADLRSYNKRTSYADELNQAKNLLRRTGFEQIPELSGPYENKTVFMVLQ